LARGQASYLSDLLAPAPDVPESPLAPDKRLVEQAFAEVLPDVEQGLRIRPEPADLVVDVAADHIRDLGQPVAGIMAVPVR